MIESIWNALNSPVAIAAIAAVVLWLLNRLYAKRPNWRRYEGTVIAAIKYAERTIPDGVENKALRRLDEALRYVLNVHREVALRAATPEEVADLREGIQIKHAELEAAGNLDAAAVEKLPGAQT